MFEDCLMTDRSVGYKPTVLAFCTGIVLIFSFCYSKKKHNILVMPFEKNKGLSFGDVFL